MMAPIRRLAVTALSLGGLINAHPFEATRRQDSRVSPVADPVQVDAGGVYMRTTTLDDGTIIGGYATGDGTDRVLRVVRSTNNGDSWDGIGVVDSGPSNERDIDNAYPLALPNGDILYSFRNHDKNSNGDYSHYRITVCKSTDGGESWSFLSHIDERQAAADLNGLWEPFLRLDGNGNVQAYYSAENRGSDQDNLMRVSTNGGESWGDSITMSGADVEARDGMIGIAEYGDGNLIGIFETTETGKMTVMYVRSTDGGLNWHSRGRVHTPPEGFVSGAPQIINVGGTLVASFMHNSGGAVDGGELRVVTSTNDGETWSDTITLSGDGTHWPGLHKLNDQRFLALYTARGEGLVSHLHEV